MEQLGETLKILSLLADKINFNIEYYDSLEKKLFNKEYSYLIEFVKKQNQKLLNKIKTEYKRLSGSLYVPAENPDNKILKEALPVYLKSDVLDNCYKMEKELAIFYSQCLIQEEILWEVLPILAKHLSIIEMSASIISDCSKENSGKLIEEKINHIANPGFAV